MHTGFLGGAMGDVSSGTVDCRALFNIWSGFEARVKVGGMTIDDLLKAGASGREANPDHGVAQAQTSIRGRVLSSS